LIFIKVLNKKNLVLEEDVFLFVIMVN